MTPVVKDNCDRALSVCHWIVPTLESDGKLKVDKMVSSVRTKSLPIEVNWEPDRLVKLLAPETVKLPPIVEIPEMSMTPATLEAMTRDPVKLVQEEARAVASA